MKAISILGTSSNAGKSWVATGLCAWLRRQGVKVAPFKAQNMANNAYATLEGGEIGVAQAIQAEACGLRPVAEMNPILLKPNGANGSQIVRLGEAGETLNARNYYETIEESWRIVKDTLDGWRTRTDVLVMEGAGSPVELNLMERDIVNLRPIEHVDGRWLLVSNIEYGGVFAQVIGTYRLLPSAMRGRGLGFAVNRFRGDLGLFAGAGEEFQKRLDLPFLGTIPFDERLRIDDEDSLNAEDGKPKGTEPYIAWVRYPQVANSQDQRPWLDDRGVQSVWTASADVLRGAAAIVLPGSKNTLADLGWLRETGLASVVAERANGGVPLVGICGGMQMLGVRLEDTEDMGSARGLGLLPVETWFHSDKRVVRNESRYAGESWETFEIHTGETRISHGAKLQSVLESRKLGIGEFVGEGFRQGNVWGTYQHGVFESPALRSILCRDAGIADDGISVQFWRESQRAVYDKLVDCLESFLDLERVKAYLEI